MQWYSTRSIKQKLMILFTATAAASLALAFLVMWTYELEAYRSILKREMLTMDELHSKLREQGVERIDEVRWAFMESDGQISLRRFKDDPGHPRASRRDSPAAQ